MNDQKKSPWLLDTAIGLIPFALAIAFLATCVSCQFRVYQKKHGDHMTFMDFLIDGEQK